MQYYDPRLLLLQSPGIYAIRIDAYGRYFWQYVQEAVLPRQVAYFQRSRRDGFVGLLTQGPSVLLPPAYLTYGLPSQYWNAGLLQQQGWPRPRAGVSFLGPFRALLPGAPRSTGGSSSNSSLASSQFNFSGFQQNIPQQPEKPSSVKGSTSKTKDSKAGGSKAKGSNGSVKGSANPATPPIGSAHQKPSPSPPGSRKPSGVKSVEKAKSAEKTQSDEKANSAKKLKSSENAKIASLKMKESSSDSSKHISVTKKSSQKTPSLPDKEKSKSGTISSDSYHPSDYPRPSQESPPPPSTAKVQNTVVVSSTEIHKSNLSKKKSNK
ncbi:hypothetical protein BDZ45DRAFT_745412 [Acephala macrosclerotiorum]|nr:hypothetical protein BDZ45DRAFT_745412 [Acephala macrosclerotiorum]